MGQNIWIQDGNTFMKGSATTKAHPEGLPKGIYEVKESINLLLFKQTWRFFCI